MTAAGYKWLLSPYGTGFFWCQLKHLETLRPGPFYWMATAVAFVDGIGPATVKAHNDRLINRLFARLPQDLVELASPTDAAHRGPYGCFRAHTPEATKRLFEALGRPFTILPSAYRATTLFFT